MINKSLEYIKHRLQSGNCNNMSLEEFQDMHVIPFKSYFLEDPGDHIILALRDNETLADLTYSPNTEFNYFITDSCVCDGTLMFMRDLMTNILKKIGQLQTCYAPALNAAIIKDINNGKSIIHYEVGDFITNAYMVEPPDIDKPWMCDRFTVMLPVKFTIEKINSKE